MNLPQFLLEKDILSAEDHAAVEAALANKIPLADALKDHGVTLEDALKAAGDAYNLPSRILGDPPADEKTFPYIPLASARQYGFVPLDVADGALEVGIVDPDNLEALDALQFISTRVGLPYKIFLISQPDFERVLEAYKNLSGEVGKALSEFASAEAADKKGARKKAEPDIEAASSSSPTGDPNAIKGDAPMTKIVSTLLRYAVEGGASDVHIEPGRDKTRVRFRMDGLLHTSLTLPGTVHAPIVARIKILSLLRLDERRKPQDGRFSSTFADRHIDFRVSTFPTEYGEKVVMRILDQSASTANLDTIGFTRNNLKTVRDLLSAPYGIVLIAGPTGSGKSTTLYSMLSELDREKYNVVSLEDPIEYEIPGVSQSQVRPEIGYTFSNGLRSILRQDPDIIMVGEIRDKETAALAVQAALTGHLVFSTIHTNTAAGAVPRLVDMGIDTYLIAPTLLAVIGQRLVRKLCGAGEAFSIESSLKMLIDKEFADLPEKYRAELPPFTQFYHAKPTSDCPTGVRGRLGVFEILRMSKRLENVLLENPVEEHVYAAAREDGMLTMREDAMVKASGGEIPFEEISTLGGDLSMDTDTPTPETPAKTEAETQLQAQVETQAEAQAEL